MRKRCGFAPAGRRSIRALVAVEPVTKDGKRITLQMNAGLLVDLPQLAESGRARASACSAPNCSS